MWHCSHLPVAKVRYQLIPARFMYDHQRSRPPCYWQSFLTVEIGFALGCCVASEDEDALSCGCIRHYLVCRREGSSPHQLVSCILLRQRERRKDSTASEVLETLHKLRRRTWSRNQASWNIRVRSPTRVADEHKTFHTCGISQPCDQWDHPHRSV